MATGAQSFIPTKSTCSNFPCLDTHCISRHPKVCKFYASFGRCKFGESCAYLHINNHLNSKVKDLESEIIQLKHQNKDLLELYQQLSDEILKIKSRTEPGSDTSNLEKCKCEKCSYASKKIETLRKRDEKASTSHSVLLRSSTLSKIHLVL